MRTKSLVGHYIAKLISVSVGPVKASGRIQERLWIAGLPLSDQKTLLNSYEDKCERLCLQTPNTKSMQRKSLLTSCSLSSSSCLSATIPHFLQPFCLSHHYFFFLWPLTLCLFSVSQAHYLFPWNMPNWTSSRVYPSTIGNTPRLGKER